MLNVLTFLPLLLWIKKVSIQVWQYGLKGSLILVDTHIFALQCQSQNRKPPSPQIFLLNFLDFTPTLEILLTFFELKYKYLKSFFYIFYKNCSIHIKYHLEALYAQLLRITLAPSVLPRLLAQNLPGLLIKAHHNSLLLIRFTIKKPSSLKRYSWIRL